MYSGGFEMQVEPIKGHKYIWACDVAGQEEETTDVEASVGIHKRDALTFIVGDLLRDGTVVPICLYQWVGKQHSKVRDMLPKIIRYWVLSVGYATVPESVNRWRTTLKSYSTEITTDW